LDTTLSLGYCASMGSPAQPVGDLLRQWRQRRRMSQLELALDAGISARHVSFLETGRSTPSREMVLHLAEELEVPLRERNNLLVAAGYAPVFRERTLQDPALHVARKAIDLVLEAQRPYPAFAFDRHWTIVASNRALPELYVGVSEALLRQPVNALRLSLHPEGMAPRIANFAQWRAHILWRLRRQIDFTGDPALQDLLRELSTYPAPKSDVPKAPDGEWASLVTPLNIIVDGTILAFFSTTTIFGTPVDVTLSEIAIESFFPADAATAQAVVRIAKATA
jgi:transcriptional regulator with XRE-family HTH domain